MRWIERAATLVGGACLAILVAIVAGSVFARYAMGQPIAWTEEAAGLLMVWIVMIAAIACEARDGHLTIDIIEHYLPPAMRRVLAAVVGLASIGLLLVIGWYGWVLADASAMRRTSILKVSWFWIYLPVALGGLLIAVVTLMRIFNAGVGDAEQESRQ
ncbi:TRAP-type C4-dicarboxylate transport system permease small subunit [Paracoccus pantotrophus]|nr:TRAP transporter small permease [Paracoccus pantotrophus]RKS52226.1 TRAP-type C4-dicarboxylate transport system permease small subunit [Paracoccus pantotrophus]